MNRSTSPHFTIGAVAKQAGVSVDTIRYYERKELLPVVRRRASGYRDYDYEAINRLHFIRRAKSLGFTLEEIRELLSFTDDHDQGVKGVKQRAEARLSEVEKRIHELERMKHGLQQLIDACPGHGALAQCPILRALSEDTQV